MPPAIFDDVEDKTLRIRNRGAILANIFERYTTSTPKGDVLLPKDLAMCMRELDEYYSRMPKHEVRAAKDAMMTHLKDRGYATKNTIS